MQKIKERWEIEKNWQLLYPFLGSIALLLAGFIVAKAILSKFSEINTILTDISYLNHCIRNIKYYIKII